MASIAPASETKCLLNLVVNDREVSVVAPPAQRLSRVLREELGLTGTKVGCDAGDCGAGIVLVYAAGGVYFRGSGECEWGSGAGGMKLWQ